MKRPIGSLAAGLLLIALGAGPAWAHEHIKDYDVEIQVEPDGSLLVTERIAVNVESVKIKRGIFRDFPTINQGPLGLRKLVPFDVMGVKRDGELEHYVVEDVQAGKRIRIGREDVLLRMGVHTFEITYRTGDQLRFFRDYDELYWNVTGHFWAFRIDVASALVRLPPSASVRSFEAYTGAVRTKGQDYTANKVDDHTVRFQTTRTLTPGEGLTVVVAFPKGIFERPPSAGLIESNLKFFIGALLVLLALLWHVVSWWRVGRDPPRGTIIPEFEAPDGYSPAACRYLWRTGFDSKCYSAAVINLAVKGRLRIEQKDKKDYVLHRMEGAKDAPDPIEQEENKLFESLLGSRTTLALKQSNHSAISGALNVLKSGLKDKLERSHIVRNLGLWLPGLLVTLVGLVLAALNSPGDGEATFLQIFLTFWSLGVVLLISGTVLAYRSGKISAGIIMTVFTLPFAAAWFVVAWMLSATVGAPGDWALAPWHGPERSVLHPDPCPPPSSAARCSTALEGLREYLSVAEEDRLNDMNPPEKTPELFEHFLPYALALDCEQEWSERFASVLAAAGEGADGSGVVHSPVWYSGHGSLAEIGTAGLAAAICSGMAASLASSAQSPSSSSGSGGGGFSGGGGGGGGGGGW